MTSGLLLRNRDARNAEHSLPFCLIDRDLYDCIPDIKYEGSIIAVEQITDAFGVSDTCPETGMNNHRQQPVL